MKKIGIVLGGGGAKGSFQIGVLDGIMKYIERNNYELVSVSGSSIGAFNGAFVASGQFETLKNYWLHWDLDDNPFTQTWFLGVALSFILRGYAYNPKPQRNFLKDNLDIRSLKMSDVAYINTRVRYSDGEMLLGGTNSKAAKPNITDDDIVSEIMASAAAIPFMTTTQVYGEHCVDGGCRDTIPVKSMIESTATTLDHVFVVGCFPYNRVKFSNVDNTPGSLFEKIKFVFDSILWDEISRNDIELGKLKHWNPETYTVICPEASVVDIDVPEFDNIKIRKNIQHGRDVWNKLGLV
jgi:predicted acylesterase/phospholipase RssA